MSFYQTLIAATAAERIAFQNTPVIRRAVTLGIPRDVYIAYLTQAYHHVKWTCPLLALAAAHAGPEDAPLHAALYEYIAEETGHETWILNDIAALGGDAEAARRSRPNAACRAMVGYVHYAIANVHPCAMLGMVHVLEGMSVRLADAAASGIAGAIGATGPEGFTYLTSHGAIDQAHVAFFETVANRIDDQKAREAVIETAQVVYRLFGAMFTEVADGFAEMRNAA